MCPSPLQMSQTCSGVLFLRHILSFATLWTVARIPCPWDFSCRNIEVGCHFLLWVIFPTQGSNLCNYISYIVGTYFTCWAIKKLAPGAWELSLPGSFWSLPETSHDIFLSEMSTGSYSLIGRAPYSGHQAISFSGLPLTTRDLPHHLINGLE